MGDIIKSYPVRSRTGERSRRLKLYFDSGSPFTFIARPVCTSFKNLLAMPAPTTFGGLGAGRFQATHVLNMEVCLLGIWCRHLAYVVPDGVLESNYDVLVGHDFMQKFHVDLLPKRRDVRLDRAALRLALVVRGRTRAVV